MTGAALGHGAIAITDRNSLAGIVRAHQAAKEVGLRLVVGCRLDLRDGTSLLAFPEDRAAYGRLTRLLTLGQAPRAQGRMPSRLRRCRGPWRRAQIVVVCCRPYPLTGGSGRGGSRGCRPGRGGFRRPRLSRRPPPLSRRRCAPPRPSRRARPTTVGLPLVATNDVLYHVPERRPLQDVLTCIREGLHDRRGRLSPRRQCRAPSEAGRRRWRGCFAAIEEAAGAQPRDRRALPISASTSCATNIRTRPPRTGARRSSASPISPGQAPPSGSRKASLRPLGGRGRARRAAMGG